ncbi:cytochrome P450 [Xylariaceae sp. FL0016]|nr:cytochrome P450 [Xylariaceae sp. FL0016]
MKVVPSGIPSGWETLHHLSLSHGPSSIVYLSVFLLIVAASWTHLASKINVKEVPIINPVRRFMKSRAKQDFLVSAKDILDRARKDFPNQPYRIMTDLGEVLMLPNCYANEVRNIPGLSLATANKQDFFGYLPGFSVLAAAQDDHQLLQAVIKNQLTRCLSKVTSSIADTSSHALLLNLGDSSEWRDVLFKPVALDVVARCASRVYLGEHLCRDPDWLRVSKEYSVSLFIASRDLRIWPDFTQRLVHWFLPECRKLRGQVDTARRVIAPVIAARRQLQQQCREAGRKAPEFNNALDWIEQEAVRKHVQYDPVNFQIMLSVVSIMGATDLLQETMLHLAQNPEFLDPLRREVAGTLREAGRWSKTAVYNMKLLDSVVKESQRLKPLFLANMRRRAEEAFDLSSGLHVKKGTRILVEDSRMRDPTLHEDPDKWDGFRFLKMRDREGKQNIAQLSTTSSDHMAFGHGLHACPGRFLAADMVKVTLCHLLIKYEWKLSPGTDTRPVLHGVSMGTNPGARLLVRRREDVEIDLESLV